MKIIKENKSSDINNLRDMLKREKEIENIIYKYGFEGAIKYRDEYHQLLSDIGKLAEKIDGKNSIYGKGIIGKLRDEMEGDKIVKEGLSFDEVVEEIHQQVKQELKRIVTSPEFGFDEDDFKHYFRVDTDLVSDHQARIEVGAEVSYDGLIEICDELNTVVEKYDKGSYFEPVDPGIIECWIELSNLKRRRNS